MKLNEMVIKNIKEAGFLVGRQLGNNIPVYKMHKRIYRYVRGSWEDFDKLKEELKKFEPGTYYISKYEKREPFGKEVVFEPDINKDKMKVLIQHLISSRFEDILSAEFCLYPDFVGYILTTEYDKSRDSQFKLIEDLFCMAKIEFLNEYSNDEDIMEFEYDERSRSYYNKDYSMVYGDGQIATGPKHSLTEYFNGRGYYHNAVLDNFWDFLCDEHDYFKEIDPEETITLYHRKGKDWYIGYSLVKNYFYLNYNDEDIDGSDDEGENDTDEEFCYYTHKHNEDLKQEFVHWCESQKKDLEIKSYIYNELEISDPYGGDVDAEDKLFNFKLLNNEFKDDIFDFVYTLNSYVDYSDMTVNESILVTKAYEKFLHKNLKNEKLFGKYRHIELLRKYAEKDGLSVEYIENDSWVLDSDYDNVYFNLCELINSAPKKFYENIKNNLVISIKHEVA